jgi:hypothetical protein
MRVAPFAFALAACVAAQTARAGDAATAETLFDQARRLMHEGSFDTACPLLEESQRLDPGVGTQFNLADCYEHEGRTASAWALFLDVAAATKAAGQTAREEASRDRAAALASKLARLTVTVPEAHPKGLVVKRDGALVGPLLWGVPVPVDPGLHLIEVTAPGRKTWRSKLVVGSEATTTALAVPALEKLSADSSASPPSPSLEPAGAVQTSEASDVPWGTQKIAAAGIGGVGIVSLIIGTGFGIDAIVKHSDSEAGCPSNTSCTAAAGAVRDSAIHAGNASTAGFVIGLAALGGATVLWLTAPGPTQETNKTARLVVLPAGAALAGTF